MSVPRPEIGAWYQTPDGTLFEVVAWDPEEEVIEVQFFDGTVEEYDLDSWGELRPSDAEPPEDWSGSLDVAGEDYGVDLDRPAGESHHNPIDDLEAEEIDLSE